MVYCEPLPAPAEAGHDLIGDHDDPELVANLPDPGEVSRWRDQDPVGSDHGLQDDRGDAVRSLDHELVPQRGQCAVALLLVGSRMERRAIGVWAPVVDDPGKARFGGPPAGVPGQCDGSGRRTVVAAVGGQDLVASRVQTCHPNRVLVGVCTPVGEEDGIEVCGGHLGDEPGGLAARIVGEGRRDGGELGGLLLDRGDELGMLVSDVDVHQLRGKVEIALARVVTEVGPGGGGDRHGVDLSLGRPGVEDVRAIVSANSSLAGEVLGR